MSKEERPQSGVNGLGGRNLESAASTRSAPANFPLHDTTIDRHNLGLIRPRKLTPLSRMPRLEENKIKVENNLHRPLHLSVNYTGNNTSHHQSPWNPQKPTLDPIAQHNGRLKRRETYTVSAPRATEIASSELSNTSDNNVMEELAINQDDMEH